ncbi:hypothetical protein CDL12_10404 [Handroanthus impetiginosus]|uniref:Uncharacterized protein n=1 Tax=Handroanthus impetiginosus TaxID=429701 RepID=A0A2G9HHE8_9LAMI|nr:hypothetical protein CDL12_10404 [Handroanthus impetiginosus]
MCLQEIKKEITEIRNCYEESSTVCYDDDELARMMLLDACFITVHIATVTWPFKFDNDPERIVDLLFNHFCQLSTSIALRDMCLVDNQIPFWIVKFLLSIYYMPENQEKVVDCYLTIFLFGEFYSAKRTPRYEYGSERVLALDIHEPRKTRSSHVNCCFSVKERTNADLESELKANGIHLKSSPTQSLEDVNFKSNFMYAELQLPSLSLCPDNKTLFLNMICYELDPETMSEGSDEEIVKMYQDLNTQGADNPLVYRNVKDMIQAQCNSKTKTWMAELIHTYFRSPWTFITLLATTCLLVLTTL